MVGSVQVGACEVPPRSVIPSAAVVDGSATYLESVDVPAEVHRSFVNGPVPDVQPKPDWVPALILIDGRT